MNDEYLSVDSIDETPVSHADVRTVAHHLDARGVAHEVIEHETTMTARADARAAAVPPEATAKTVVLTDDDVYLLAVVPASEQIDVRKVRDAFGADKSLRMATEAEMTETFSAFEAGAVPPLGEMVFAAEVVDRRLLGHDQVLCGGGDHRHSILLDPNELVRVTDASVGDLCAD